MIDVKWQQSKIARIKAMGPRFDHKILSQNLMLHDLMGGSLCGYPAGYGVVKHGNFIKLTVAAEMIEMSVRVDNCHRFVSYLCYGLTQVPNSTTGVDQGRLFRSDH